VGTSFTTRIARKGETRLGDPEGKGKPDMETLARVWAGQH